MAILEETENRNFRLGSLRGLEFEGVRVLEQMSLKEGYQVAG
ncbi:hypothetical protein SAMN05421594_2063 [Chryseobacterium oleae]|uniref:Uncharacterized protein n=1 Tax=Chryseobacterium oleae TaxID=491207 RepID=A0A1I4XTV0_CHROL|nr:hypothetical protein [Chryseobacterium oleae]SFN28680.1 hypothetical protein SAMN05421594_2063 [Chryseobacterium oleae]